MSLIFNQWRGTFFEQGDRK